jgi:hypothetical protein
MRVLSQSLVWVVGVWPHDIFGRMTFLDLTEGDKLAVVVVELHVGPRRQCDALGN